MLENKNSDTLIFFINEREVGHMKEQTLFTAEELAKVETEGERRHLIECAKDNSKIDMNYIRIMDKYGLWERSNNGGKEV